MDITPFNAPVSSKGRAKVIKIHDGARRSREVLRLQAYEATDGQPKQWRVLHGMGEVSGDNFPGG